ncbi:uncharacterized protein PSFLO_02275 [Pseudozyma flocculosa]|uniref:Uncharacterized protein n=1 Tax=Pseudozyma flocculosa TaxID=84751 RepID=A0A5C3EX46_9BASI|nr:uncharacterized protein PSFLO_02275 [Pseudozyma flocculosa]
MIRPSRLVTLLAALCANTTPIVGLPPPPPPMPTHDLPPPSNPTCHNINANLPPPSMPSCRHHQCQLAATIDTKLPLPPTPTCSHLAHNNSDKEQAPPPHLLSSHQDIIR